MSTHEEALSRAQMAVEVGASEAKPCPWRPVYHFTAPIGWINDPNGVIHYRGLYHLFYQHYPDAPKWGPMHWGHAVSSDGVRWRHLPIALAPNEANEVSKGGCGCFSGSAVEVDGKLALMYTAHSEAYTPKETQNLAISEDGVRFTKYAGNPVIANFPEEATHDFRDPKVWRHGDHYYVVIGTGKDGVGKALLYRSPDLIAWTYMGVMAQSDGKLGHMWECPDYFELDGKGVLIFSPIGLGRPVSAYLIGELDYTSGRFTAETSGLIDHGSDFYAPQTTSDPAGRRVMIAWMQAWGHAVPTEASGWSGAMTVMRELRVREGRLVQQPVAELASLRREAKAFGELRVAAGETWTLPVRGTSYELALTLHGESAAVRVRGSATQYTEIRWDARAGTLTVDRERAGNGPGGTFVADAPGEGVALRIFVDKSSVEVFTADGAVALTCRIYPDAASDGIVLSSESGAEFSDVRFWELAP